MTRRATFAELVETWAQTDRFWHAGFPEHDGPEWVRAGFRVQTFKTLLRQKGLRPAPLDMCAGAGEQREER